MRWLKGGRAEQLRFYLPRYDSTLSFPSTLRMDVAPRIPSDTGIRCAGYVRRFFGESNETIFRKPPSRSKRCPKIGPRSCGPIVRSFFPGMRSSSFGRKSCALRRSRRVVGRICSASVGIGALAGRRWRVSVFRKMETRSAKWNRSESFRILGARWRF